MEAQAGWLLARSILVVVVCLLSLLICWALVKLYRRAVMKTMARMDNGSDKPPIPAVPTFMPPAPLDPKSVIAKVQDLSVRRLCVQLVAGLLYGLTMTIFSLWSTETEMFATRLAVLTLFYGWPGLLIAILKVLPDASVKRQLLLGYFSLFTVLSIYVLWRSPDLTIAQLFLLWAYTNGSTTFLVLFFLHRGIRAVGPLVLALMLTCVGGTLVLLPILAEWDTGLRVLSDAGHGLGMDATKTLLAIIFDRSHPVWNHGMVADCCNCKSISGETP
jgi:hypothetical protein